MSDIQNRSLRWPALLRTSTCETAASAPHPVVAWRPLARENENHVVKQEVAEEHALDRKAQEGMK